MNILKEIWERLNIEHFAIEEVTLGRSIPEAKLVNIEETIKFADAMRESVGLPIVITSSYRNPSLNESVGGSSTSLHLQFNALDLVPMSGKKEDLVEMRKFVNKNRTRLMGVGFYDSFIHLDFRGLLCRPSPKTW